MAANGSVDEQSAAGGGELDDTLSDDSTSTKMIVLNGTKLFGSPLDVKAVLDDRNNKNNNCHHDHAGDLLASRLAATSWITSNNNNKVVSSAAPLTFCSQDDPSRRTLRIDRSGSTESVVTTSGGDSSSSEPGSPSRPVTPHHLSMAPDLPTSFECLRADSEDSGLGPSPAKSLTGPTSPEGSVSPIRFDDRSDSLFDLSPRTDNSDDLLLSEENHHCDDCDDKPPSAVVVEGAVTAIPQLPSSQGGGTFHQFLLASKNCVVNTNLNSNNNNTSVVSEAEDFRIHFPATPVTDCEEDEDEEEEEEEMEDEDDDLIDDDALTPPSSDLLQQKQQQQIPRSPLGKTFENSASSSNVDDDTTSSLRTEVRERSVAHHKDSSLLNPKVVLIRSDFGGQYTEESCSQQSSQSSQSTGTSSSSSNSSSGSVSGHAYELCCPSGAVSEQDGACKWLNCDRSADANTTLTDLIDHIRQCHVRSQTEDAESFVCLWVGCKVYARPSCSRSWLERHVLLHGGSKPFRCIVAGCRQRFGTEVALQRHVNSHFPQAGKHTQNAHQHKLSRNRRRHYKHRRRPQSNKSKDFFDDAIMEHVRHHLLQLSSIESVVTTGPPSAITFHSKVMGKRKSEAGKVHYLLHWSPENIVPDTWVAEDEVNHHTEKTIPVSQLPPEALQPPVMDSLGLSGVLTRPGKRKRK